MGSGQVMLTWSREGKRFFFEKKKQKTFIKLGRAGFAASGPVKQKFLRRFFQKAASFLFPLKPVGL
jgi:hypothetical protein